MNSKFELKKYFNAHTKIVLSREKCNYLFIFVTRSGPDRYQYFSVENFNNQGRTEQKI